jgi:hypothetical protein
VHYPDLVPEYELKQPEKALSQFITRDIDTNESEDQIQIEEDVVILDAHEL